MGKFLSHTLTLIGFLPTGYAGNGYPLPSLGHAGFKICADRVDESRSKSGSQPNTVPEPPMVPDSGGQLLVREGEPSVSRTSVAPEAPDCLLEALRGASMDEEHRTL